MSENARGKGRKPALGDMSARQIPSLVQPSGVSIDELTDQEEVRTGSLAGMPQMGRGTVDMDKETPPPQRRRQRA